MNWNFVSVVLLSLVPLSAPIFIAAIGNMYCERVGVLNLGAEGMMVSGAFFAVLGSHFLHNPWLGVVCGILGGMLAGAVHGVICVEFGGIHAISGLGITMLFNGITKFLCISIFGSTFTPNVASLTTTNFLADIPLVGSFLAGLSPLIYIAFMLAILSQVFVFHTSYGIRVQAVGDDPLTVETAGINVWKMRFLGVLICGAFCGLAGAYMSLGQLDRFFDGMISGKGMLAVIAVKMGNWMPAGILGTALLLGLCDSIQFQLQINGVLKIPPEMLQMLPYIVGIIVLSMQRSENTRPTALDTVYLKGKYKY